jgi:hypothetical protein
MMLSYYVAEEIIGYKALDTLEDPSCKNEAKGRLENSL